MNYRTVSLILLAALGYTCYQFVPIGLKVYASKNEFHRGLRDVAGKATLRQWDDRIIARQVKTLAQAKGFRVSANDIYIQRVSGRAEVTVVVTYSRLENFPGGFAYFFQFHSNARSFDAL